MSLPKLKNLVILILVLVNLVLLALVIPLRLEQKSQQALSMSRLQALFATHELTLGGDTLPRAQPLYTLELTPSDGAALRAAQSLLGETIMVLEDSTPYKILYQTKNSTFYAFRNGMFGAQFAQRAPTADTAQEVTQLLEKMQLETAAVSFPVRVDAGVYELTATQQLLGVPVFTAQQIFTFDAGALTQIQGEALFDTATLARVDDSVCIGAADALVAFLASRDALGWVGSAVTRLTQGYARTETASAAVIRLIPGWNIVTDTGAFWVNGVTREVSAL